MCFILKPEMIKSIIYILTMALQGDPSTVSTFFNLSTKFKGWK